MNCSLESSFLRTSTDSSPGKPIARWNTVRDVWEVGQTSLFCEHAGVFSGIWCRSGMIRDGIAYQLPSLEHPTGGNVYSFSELPTPSSRDWKSGKSNLMERNARPLNETIVNLLPSPVSRDYKGLPGRNVQMASLPREISLLPTPSAGVFNDGEDLESWEARRQANLAKGINGNGQGTPLSIAVQQQDWGRFEAAIQRWEAITGRPAPVATEPGRTAPRLSPRFVEWLMNLPEGWVVDVPRVTRKDKLRCLGNGVVVAQAALAFRLLLEEKR